jgi:hypothetical protein
MHVCTFLKLSPKDEDIKQTELAQVRTKWWGYMMTASPMNRQTSSKYVATANKA